MCNFPKTTQNSKENKRKHKDILLFQIFTNINHAKNKDQFLNVTASFEYYSSIGN